MEPKTFLISVFIVGCLLSITALALTIFMTPKPTCAWCHVRGVGRISVLAGAGFGLARVLSSSWVPTWDMVLYVFGIGVLSGMHCREMWLKAKDKQRHEEQQISQAGA